MKGTIEFTNHSNEKYFSHPITINHRDYYLKFFTRLVLW
jgi:hypothetical protein